MDFPKIADVACKIEAGNFVKLINSVIQQLSEEQGQVGNLSITEKLVTLVPTGEAVVVGDLHGDPQSLRIILENSQIETRMSQNKDTALVSRRLW